MGEAKADGDSGRATGSGLPAMPQHYRPVTPGTQAVRIATAMTGGVSLAVWMGGVARELNLLEQAARRRDAITQATSAREQVEAVPSAVTDDGGPVELILYLRLLDLLDLTVDIDMLSGTSAGGINAALLGLTRVRRLDLALLRDVWLQAGALETLLREPTEKRPPSLLQGDGVLLDQLSKGIERICGEGRGDPTPAAGTVHETTVFITTTLLTGEESRFVDSFGTRVADSEHRGLFAFDHDQLGNDANQAALALAARSSASYPLAFEPAFVPCGADGPDARHPDMQPFSNTTGPHFVADGGLLMNRPLNPLLERIFYRRAQQQVRRVLLYVVPLPGDTPTPGPTLDQFDQPYTLVQGLAKDVGAVLNQSISAELRAIRDHNDRVEAVGDARLRIAELGVGAGLSLLRPAAFTDFRDRQAKALARATVTALTRGITMMPAERLPEAWRGALKAGSTADQEWRDAATKAVTEGWPVDIPAVDDVDAVARLGRAPYDGAKATVLAMLRSAWVLAGSSEDRAALSVAAGAVHDALGPPTVVNLAELVAEALAEIKRTTTSTPAEIASSVAREVAGSTDPDYRAFLVAAWHNLAGAVDTVAATLHALVEGTPGAAGVGTDATRRAAAAATLGTYLAYLEPTEDETVEGGTPEEQTIARLFQLHVVVRSMQPVAAEVEQPVELVQVSAETRSALAPDHTTATAKLTGIQLHHFGAFYKSSWRANDWMWGRLDGAGWIVHLLLDPRRILTVATDADIDVGERVDWFVARLDERFPGLGAPPDAVKAQLAYLDLPEAPLPRSLPDVALWLAAAWQRIVAAAELPVVAREVLKTPSRRDTGWAVSVLKHANRPETLVAAAQAVVAAVADGADAAELTDYVKSTSAAMLTGPNIDELVAKLRDCPVPKETLGAEVGEPLFTRTVTKATAVAAAATADADELPTILRPTFAALRSTTLIAHRLATFTRGHYRPLAAIGAAALLLGTIIATWFGSLVGVSGVIIASAGAFLLVLVGWRSITRIRDWVLLALTALAIAAIGALFSDDVRAWLFGDADEPGLVAHRILPWLREPAWHAPAVLAAVVLVAVTIASGMAARRRRRRKRPPDAGSRPVGIAAATRSDARST